MQAGLQRKLSLRDSSVLGVSELTTQLRTLVEDQYPSVHVEGEVSNFTRAASGHCYFTLKDADAQIRCVMWRGTAARLSFQPQDGMLVRTRGTVSLYERRGDLQIKVDRLKPAGEGALQKAFEALKKKLSQEGLFDEEHKRPLPPFPQTVGIVTSGSGAALHDITTTLQRRFPCVTVLFCPVKVQGVDAASGIAEAVSCLNDHATPPDVLIVGRGGGSTEDLWAFNEEAVARAIFASRVPVVSAVGHETDFSIADFVADKRAPTPSIAAELVVPDGSDMLHRVQTICSDIRSRLQSHLHTCRQRLDHLANSYALRRSLDRIGQERQELDRLTDRLDRCFTQRMHEKKQHLENIQQRTRLLDPRRPLDRGYVKVERDGTAVNAARVLEADDRVLLRFTDGERRARIEE